MSQVIDEYRDLAEPKNIALISSTHGVNEFFSIAIPPIIPFLVADLDITFAQAGLLLTVFFIMYSIFQLPAGMLADRIGKKRLLVAGMLMMAGGIFLAGTAQTYEMLVLAQVITGIGGSTYHPTGMSLISDFESHATEGKAMGVFGFGGMTGIAAAPLVIGGLAGFIDWRFALGVAAVLGIIVTIAFWVFFSDPGTKQPPRDTAETDVAGNGGASVPPQHEPVWVRVKRYTSHLLNVPLTWGVVLLLLVTMLVSLQTRAIMTFTTSYVFESTGQSVSMSNVVFFVMLVAGSLSSLWAGSLADRFDRGLLGVTAAIVTAVLLGITFVFVGFAGAFSQVILLGALLVLFFVIGVAMYACAPIKNALISQHAEESFSGSLFGITQTVGAFGSALGPALFGFLATEYTMTAAYPMIAVVSIFIAGAFFLLSRDVKTRRQQGGGVHAG